MSHRVEYETPEKPNQRRVVYISAKAVDPLARAKEHLDHWRHNVRRPPVDDWKLKLLEPTK